VIGASVPFTPTLYSILGLFSIKTAKCRQKEEQTTEGSAGIVNTLVQVMFILPFMVGLDKLLTNMQYVMGVSFHPFSTRCLPLLAASTRRPRSFLNYTWRQVSRNMPCGSATGVTKAMGN
jgi:hypothetical protein